MLRPGRLAPLSAEQPLLSRLQVLDDALDKLPALAELQRHPDEDVKERPGTEHAGRLVPLLEQLEGQTEVVVRLEEGFSVAPLASCPGLTPEHLRPPAWDRLLV